MSGRFLAVDWGTTNRRVFVIEGGAAAATERDARGAAAVSDYPAEIADIRARFGDLPLLLAGMVGSNVGWQVVPYVAAPAGLAELAAQVARIDGRTFIIPGLACSNAERADVMRGEEVQLLGAVASGLVPADARLCQPGTHCKWATLVDGRVTSFTTAMTGELFALLRTHGLLARQLGGEVTAGAAFRAGVAEGRHRDLAASLFGVRASGILGRRDESEAAAFVSGLLIGADVAARLAENDAAVHILADPALGVLYAAAIAELGGDSVAVDSHAAFIAGVTRLWDLIA